MPAARKPVISAPEQANTSVSKSRDGQTSPTRLLLAGSSRHFIGSLHPSVHPSLHPSILDTTEGRVIRRLHQPATGEGADQGKRESAAPTSVFPVGGGAIHFLSKDKTRSLFLAAAVAAQLAPWHVYVQTVTSPPRPPLHRRLVSPTGKLFLLRAGWQ